jgi:hypothetical protein
MFTGFLDRTVLYGALAHKEMLEFSRVRERLLLLAG